MGVGEEPGQGKDLGATAPQSLFTFHVTGAETQQTALPTHVHAFDETYEIAAEHPAEALGRLLDEIEWGILDSEQEFTIEFIPNDDCGAVVSGKGS